MRCVAASYDRCKGVAKADVTLPVKLFDEALASSYVRKRVKQAPLSLARSAGMWAKEVAEWGEVV